MDDATTIVDTPTDSSLLKPIVFTLSNVEPDVFLNVFGQEIQVHSMCLSVASPYFRKFLGDRLGRYEWVTKVEEGGKGWVLVRGDLMVCLFFVLFLLHFCVFSSFAIFLGDFQKLIIGLWVLTGVVWQNDGTALLE